MASMTPTELVLWRDKRRLQGGRFLAQRRRNAEAWAHAAVWGSKSTVGPVFWGVFKDLAKETTFGPEAISEAAQCDFGPCWPTRRSCSYMRVCSARRHHTPA